jgi:hypothetical protein
VTTKHEEELSLQTITLCYPTTGWFEVVEIEDKTSKGASKVY